MFYSEIYKILKNIYFEEPLQTTAFIMRDSIEL